MHSLKFLSATTKYCYRICTYLLTPWSRVLLEKLTGSAASQEIPHIFGTRKFITVLTSARHPSLSWANSIQSPQPPPTSWKSILILSSHLYIYICIYMCIYIWANLIFYRFNIRTDSYWYPRIINIGLIFTAVINRQLRLYLHELKIFGFLHNAKKLIHSFWLYFRGMSSVASKNTLQRCRPIH